MESRIVYRNSEGVKRTMLVDQANPDQFTVHTEVQMDDVLKSVEADREAELAQRFKTNRHLAKVPMTVYEESILKNWDDDDWKKWLNDPDNSYFRVWPGKV